VHEFKVEMTCGGCASAVERVSLVVVTLPKLPQFHGVRLFNINKY